MNIQQCYQILRVTPESDKEEIQKNYYKLAKKYHPDVNQEPEADEIFGRIKEAYDILIEERNKEYSERIHNLNKAKEKFYQKREYYENAKAEFDRKKVQREAEEDNTIKVSLNLTFKEAIFGCEKTISFDRKHRCRSCKGTKIAKGGRYIKCTECNGKGVKVLILDEEEGLGDSHRFEFECESCQGQGRVINKLCKPCNGTGHEPSQVEEAITIPAGIENDTVMKFKNMGHFIMHKGSGELWLNLTVEEHPIFMRKGTDIYSDLTINVFQGALGDRIDIDVLRGKFRVNIPRGTNHGETLTLENLGIKNPYKLGPRVGNHYLNIFLEVPEIKDEAILSLLSEYE